MVFSMKSKSIVMFLQCRASWSIPGIPSIIISSGFPLHCSENPGAVRHGSRLLIYANELVEGPEVRINVSGDFGSPLSKKALAEKRAADLCSRHSTKRLSFRIRRTTWNNSRDCAL